MRLAIVLRFLAGGQTVDLATIYHVTRKEVYNTIWRGVDAINKVLEMPEDLWDDPDKLGVIEAQFRSKSRSTSWVGQVGAVDGCHFKTKNPGVKVPNPRDYFVARKAEYALLATAVCDNDRRFTYWDISCTPTTHDSTAWAQCSLGIRVAERGLPGPFFFNGDGAYSAGVHMVCPFNKTEHTDFDWVQSSNRMAIECAFGILIRRWNLGYMPCCFYTCHHTWVRTRTTPLICSAVFYDSFAVSTCACLPRWGILWRPLEVDVERRALLIGCCMRLHNYCIDHRISEERLATMNGELGELDPGEADVVPARYTQTPLFDRNDRPVDYLDWNIDEPTPGAADTGGVHGDREATRERLRRGVELDGTRRPPSATR